MSRGRRAPLYLQPRQCLAPEGFPLGGEAAPSEDGAPADSCIGVERFGGGSAPHATLSLRVSGAYVLWPRVQARRLSRRLVIAGIRLARLGQLTGSARMTQSIEPSGTAHVTSTRWVCEPSCTYG